MVSTLRFLAIVPAKAPHDQKESVHAHVCACVCVYVCVIFMGTMVRDPVNVSIRGRNGFSTELQVEPGTAVSEILDHEACRLPAVYRACLASETAKILESGRKVWESQVMTFVRFKNVIPACNKRPCQRNELVFVHIPGQTVCVEDGPSWVVERARKSRYRLP